MLRVALRSAMPARVELDSKNPMITRPFAPGLRAHLVLDSPTSISFVTRDTLQAWEVSAEEAFAAALGNLAELAKEGLELYDEQPSRIWHLDSDDAYEAARLAVPGFLASFRDRVEGRPIAIIPERGSLFVAGDANPDTLARLVEMASREYLTAQRNLSCAVYTVDDAGEVIPYEVPPGHPAYPAVREAHLKFAASEYELQKKELDALFTENGTDVYVATASLVRHAQRGALSYCVWTLGVPSLLPATAIVFVNNPADEAERIEVAWEDLRRAADPVLQLEPGMFPPRWRTPSEVPTSILDAIRAVARRE